MRQTVLGFLSRESLKNLALLCRLKFGWLTHCNTHHDVAAARIFIRLAKLSYSMLPLREFKSKYPEIVFSLSHDSL